jgi:hypothetical protein
MKLETELPDAEVDKIIEALAQLPNSEKERIEAIHRLVNKVLVPTNASVDACVQAIEFRYNLMQETRDKISNLQRFLLMLERDDEVMKEYVGVLYAEGTIPNKLMGRERTLSVVKDLCPTIEADIPEYVLKEWAEGTTTDERGCPTPHPYAQYVHKSYGYELDDEAVLTMWEKNPHALPPGIGVVWNTRVSTGWNWEAYQQQHS